MQPQLWILIHKTCYLVEISKKTSAYSIASFRHKITETWLLKIPPSVGNQSTQIPSVSRSHLTASHTVFLRCTQAHSLPSAYSDPCISLTSNMHVLSFSCLHHVTSSPTAYFTYYHHMQRNKRTSGLLTSFSVHVLYKHFYCHISTTLP